VPLLYLNGRGLCSYTSREFQRTFVSSSMAHSYTYNHQRLRAYQKHIRVIPSAHSELVI
jgi:hypothetical protein